MELTRIHDSFSSRIFEFMRVIELLPYLRWLYVPSALSNFHPALLPLFLKLQQDVRLPEGLRSSFRDLSTTYSCVRMWGGWTFAKIADFVSMHALLCLKMFLTTFVKISLTVRWQPSKCIHGSANLRGSANRCQSSWISRGHVAVCCGRRRDLSKG